MNRRKVAWIIVGCMAVAATVLVVFLLSFAARNRQQQNCKAVEIRIERGNEGVYLQQQDIEDWLEMHGILILGKPMKTLNASNIEDVMRQNPFVAEAQVYATEDGVYHIRTEQRSPKLKVLNSFQEVFQIDQYGVQMPVNLKYNSRTRVASGHIPYKGKYGKSVCDIPDTVGRVLLKRLYEIEVCLSSDPLWNAMFEQIYVTDMGEVELVPKVGGQIVELGYVSGKADLNDKLVRLKWFYKKAMGPEAWQKYSKLSLKYNGQLVATRKAGY